MKFTFIFAAITFAVAVAAQQPNWQNCATGPTDMTVTSFSVSPYPLCIGQNACFTAVGTLSNPVLAPATIGISGKYLGRVVYTDHQDGCTILSASGHPCPLPVTTTSLTFCVLVKFSAPANIPIAMAFTVINGNSNVLLCQSATGIQMQNCV